MTAPRETDDAAATMWLPNPPRGISINRLVTLLELLLKRDPMALPPEAHAWLRQPDTPCRRDSR